jgi:hypothetical protein
MTDQRPTVDGRTYRFLDYATKFAALALVVAGLEIGGATPLGLILGVSGVVLGLITIFIGKR